MNDAKLDQDLAKLSKANETQVLKLRERETRGELPPVLLDYDQKMGFNVVAAMDIPNFTLLSEYCGEVRTSKQI